ncbi:hypothetical protein OSB04_029233 [Centaurea solstitialis]|uniref:RRM domain-containing protein n=1 Tax=Centaurea solstitialis TaxID=347529 RepID=A0AA38T0T9_9ASTR|nr:hypothetical protein OSB04_029233 [Centaurea solstitialis]
MNGRRRVGAWKKTGHRQVDARREFRLREDQSRSREDDWQTVERKKAKKDTRRIYNFFFTRFPDCWNEEALFNMFLRYGKATNLFLAKKRTKRGTRFGFVSFETSGDWRTLEKSLQGIQIGEKRLVINREKYAQNAKSRNRGDSQEKYRSSDFRQGETYKRATHKEGLKLHNWSKNTVDGRSFKEAVLGTASKGYKEKEELVVHAAIDADKFERLHRCWAGRMKNIDCLRNIHKILKEDGVGACKIQYVGGLHVLCEWPSIDAAMQSLEANKETLNSWFAEVKMWDKESIFKGRLTWLDLEGLPVEAWSEVTIHNIASAFGNVLEVDPPLFDGSMSNTLGALIHTETMEDINTVVKVKVLNKSCKIKVFEQQNRAIFFGILDRSQSELASRLDVDDVSSEGISDSFSEEHYEPSPVRNSGNGQSQREGSGRGADSLEPENVVDVPEELIGETAHAKVKENYKGHSQNMVGQSKGPEVEVTTGFVNKESDPSPFINMPNSKRSNLSCSRPTRENKSKGFCFFGQHSSEVSSSNSRNSTESWQSKQTKDFGRILGVKYEGKKSLDGSNRQMP